MELLPGQSISFMIWQRRLSFPSCNIHISFRLTFLHQLCHIFYNTISITYDEGESNDFDAYIHCHARAPSFRKGFVKRPGSRLHTIRLCVTSMPVADHVFSETGERQTPLYLTLLEGLTTTISPLPSPKGVSPKKCWSTSTTGFVWHFQFLNRAPICLSHFITEVPQFLLEVPERQAL